MCEKDAEIGGYKIPANVPIMVQYFSITRFVFILDVCLTLCLSLCQFTWLYLSVCLSVCMSLSLFLSLSLSLYPSLSVCLLVCRFIVCLFYFVLLFFFAVSNVCSILQLFSVNANFKFTSDCSVAPSPSVDENRPSSQFS